jgi:hypothetical protein
LYAGLDNVEHLGRGAERLLTALWAGLKQVRQQSTLALFGFIVACVTALGFVVLPGLSEGWRIVGLCIILVLIGYIVSRATKLAERAGPELLLGERFYAEHLRSLYGTRERPLASKELHDLPRVTPPASVIELQPAPPNELPSGTVEGELS